jgi:hypothetical protein
LPSTPFAKADSNVFAELDEFIEGDDGNYLLQSSLLFSQDFEPLNCFRRSENFCFFVPVAR